MNILFSIKIGSYCKAAKLFAFGITYKRPLVRVNQPVAYILWLQRNNVPNSIIHREYGTSDCLSFFRNIRKSLCRYGGV